MTFFKKMRNIVILCLCLVIFDLNDGVEVPAELLQRIEEAKEQMKKPQSMFDRPKCDGVLGQACRGGDVFPYHGDMMAEMMATGPNCRKITQDCGTLYPPCCKLDPDTQEPVNLMCKYPEDADVTKKYVAGTCEENPNPPPIQKLPVPLGLNGFK